MGKRSNRIPYVRLYADDWISSRSWALDEASFGLYAKLLIVQASDGGEMDDDLETLARRVGMTRTRFKNMWPKIAHFFEKNDGKIYQKRMKNEAFLSAIEHEKAVEDGRKGGFHAHRRGTPPTTNQEPRTKNQEPSISPPTPQGGGAGEGQGRIDGGLGLTPEQPPPPKAGRKPKAPPEIPTVEMVENYMRELGWVAPSYWARLFHRNYADNNWKKKDGTPLLKWKTAVAVTWDKNRLTPEPSPSGRSTAQHNGRPGPTQRTPEGLRSAFAPELQQLGLS